MTRLCTSLLALPLLALAALSSPATAAITFNEATGGDLSNNNLAPTNIGPLGLGVSVISGRSGLPVNATPGDPELQADIDYATFTIAPGQRIDRLEVLISDVGGAFSFIGIERGPQVSVPYDTVDASTLLGWYHYGSADQGQDILLPLSASPGAIGFDGTLGPGTYTLWIMELDRSRQYDYSFGIRVIPTPGAAGLLGLVAAMTLRRRRA